jgi:exodeoxyribonuclease-1
MAASFLFYDLETTGIRASSDRIMQFAAQRTDLDLSPVGDPIDIRLKLTADILPAPEAILTSRIITSDNQKVGISEAEFADIFNNQVSKPETIFVGFNNLRFDDEFIRYTNYRNFYDAYAWHWQNSASRWDILDVVRMTRALRPKGIEWPFKEDDKPSNRLEHLTAANKLSHANAHDALSDTLATIEVAKLIKDHQPKLFSYLLSIRSKKSLINLISQNDVLVYTSSHYASEFLNTTVVAVLSVNTDLGTAQVFDLRQNASDFLDLDVEHLTKLWEYDPDKPRPQLPVKTIKLNRCPALAPISVLDPEALKRLNLNMDSVKANLKLVEVNKANFSAKLGLVTKKLDAKRDERRTSEPHISSVDEQLYEQFIPKSDSVKFETARDKATLKTNFEISFSDQRLSKLYELYRARNYPKVLSPEELANWRDYVKDKLFSGEISTYSKYTDHLDELIADSKDKNQLKLLKDLRTYTQTIANDYET